MSNFVTIYSNHSFRVPHIFVLQHVRSKKPSHEATVINPKLHKLSRIAHLPTKWNPFESAYKATNVVAVAPEAA